MDPPNLLALLALVEVARHGSVTKAAAALHLTQSAVSHRLRAFERELGRPLLEKVGRGVRLTLAAQDLARAAGAAVDQLNLAIARAAPDRTERVLSISCAPSFAIRFLVPRLAAFRSAHPQLDLRIAAADIAVDPPQGADAAVHLASRPAAGLWSEKLIEESVYPVVSPRLLRDKPLRSLDDLAQHTLLYDEALAGDPGHIGWLEWIAAARAGASRRSGDDPPARAAGAARAGSIALARSRLGFNATTAPPGTVRFSHSYLALEAAVAGDGVALARQTVVADDLARGRLVAPFERAVPSGLGYWFVSALDPALRPSLSKLHSFLRQQLSAAHGAADRARRALSAAVVSDSLRRKAPARKRSRR